VDVERVSDVVNSDRIYRHSSAQAEESMKISVSNTAEI
jgi:hypothetical protein